MISTRFFISPSGGRISKNEKKRNCALGLLTDRRATLRDQYNTFAKKEKQGIRKLRFCLSRKIPWQFVFDKKPIRGRGYEQYEQSAGMDRSTLSSGCNMGR
jgi:hypothetical protein